MYVTMGLRECLRGYENACGASPAVCMWETLFYSLNDVHTDKNHDTSSQSQSQSHLYLGRVALSALGWYQEEPCVNVT